MSPLSVPTSWAHLALMGHPRGPPPHLSDPVGHDVGAGGAEMEVEDHHADHHHGRHQQHDEKQVPGVALAQGGGDAQSHPGDPEIALAVPGGAQDSLADEGDGVGGLGEALGDEQEEDGLGQEHRDHQGHLLTTWRAGKLRAQVPLPVSHPKGPHMGFSLVGVAQGPTWVILHPAQG